MQTDSQICLGQAAQAVKAIHIHSVRHFVQKQAALGYTSHSITHHEALREKAGSFKSVNLDAEHMQKAHRDGKLVGRV